MSSLTGKRIAILATDGFEQAELIEPRSALDQAGAATEVVSLEAGDICAWKTKQVGQFTVQLEWSNKKNQCA